MIVDRFKDCFIKIDFSLVKGLVGGSFEMVIIKLVRLCFIEYLKGFD